MQQQIILLFPRSAKKVSPSSNSRFFAAMRRFIKRTISSTAHNSVTELSPYMFRDIGLPPSQPVRSTFEIHSRI
jgi:hypothetical protein